MPEAHGTAPAPFQTPLLSHDRVQQPQVREVYILIMASFLTWMTLAFTTKIPPSPHDSLPSLQSHNACHGLDSCGQWATTPQILACTTLHPPQSSTINLDSDDRHERGSEDLLTNGDAEAPRVEPCVTKDNPMAGEVNETHDTVDGGSFDCHSVSSESELSSDVSYVDSPDGSVVSPSSPHGDMLQDLLEERKRRVVDEVMEHFLELFKEGQYDYQANPGDAGEDFGGARECDTRNNGPSFGSTSSSSRGKRKANDSSPPGGQEDGDGSKKQNPDPSGDPKSPSQVDSNRRLGCPYYKRQAMRGEIITPKSTSCVIPGFSTIYRLRHHRRSIHCPRCYVAFASEQQLKPHLTAEEQCEELPNPPPIEGFDKEQEVELRTRRRDKRSMTVEQKWRDTYRILFPHDSESTYPNPYCEHEQGGAPSTPYSEELAQLDAYVRQELPRFVRAKLERTVELDNGHLRESLISQLVDLARDCQEEVSASFWQREATLARANGVYYQGGHEQPTQTSSIPTTALGGHGVVSEVVQAPTPITDEGASNVPTIEETRLSRSSADSPT
ncbi:zn2 cys6 dna-binding protein [Diplodia corticola]|uniref:Zn2 cys6 dna-binding protein n=1 Tax=Diplodia corticola TaxID=236234 RepID=A0A1J9REZ4_9PEZI|nr:zn2 cys6 dna-binding protein [Diplodia corticola]OJD38666.1 zn2 cys6 dna-binding protein [Diplodia corticola]